MSAVATARRLGGAMLPCPVCAASVRGENLERHLARHGPGEPPLHRRLRRPTFVALQYALAEHGRLAART